MVLYATWVDNNIIVGPNELVINERKKIASHIKIDDIGEIEEFVGCKIERNGNSVRLMQPIITQSFVDEFKIGSVKRVMPGDPGTIIQKPAESDEKLPDKMQSKYRSGI